MRPKKLLSTAAIASSMMAICTSPSHANNGAGGAPTQPEASGGGELTAFSAWKDIEAFREWRDIEAFREWRDIEAFRSWGEIEAFRGWRDIEAFREWRDIEAFRGWGDIVAFHGWRDIEAFGGGLNAYEADLSDDWRILAAMNDPDEMLTAINEIVSKSEAFWGAAVTEKTGLSFDQAFADKLLAKYGIDLNDKNSLSNLTIADLVYFQFEWNDGLWGFSGMDHIDWWMSATNWNPNITVVQGSGRNTVIGLIDAVTTNDVDLQGNTILWDGSTSAVGGHGGAVASLMVANHDGQGVMGIAPGASVAAYNPFNANGTATYDSVANGLKQVVGAGASVVNMSLGVSGATFDSGWVDLYTPNDIEKLLDDAVFVHAAGNDGIAQSADVEWNGVDAANLLIVGSIGMDGEISSFSNTPGSACFTKNGQCVDTLANHFIVAPGEWILVTDENGDVTRANGTSFAAPIVSGAIALMHGRWPWLADHPSETVDIILSTATDLGDPGVDEVYGHGLLDIQASQSPVQMDRIYLYTKHKNGKLKKYKIKDLAHKNSKKNMWNVPEGFFVAFEDIGDTHRDFLIPLDESLVGTYANINGVDGFFQDYLYDGFVAWSSGLGLTGTPIATPFNMDVSVSYASLAVGERTENRLDYRAELMGIAQSGTAFRVGQGDGASRLGFTEGTAMGSSNPINGGANPILGFASGGVYGSVSMPIAEGMRLSFGATERKVEQAYDDPMTGERTMIYEDLDTYQSRAVNMAVTNDVTERLSMSVSYTVLNEDNGLLGMQSLDPLGFGQGSMTNAATVGASFKAADDMIITANATYAKTHSMDDGAFLAADEVATSAFEIAMVKQGLFSDADAMRIAFVQPMQVEDGALKATQIEVIDRSTGEIGQVENSFDFSTGERRLAVEARYGARFDEAGLEFSAFARLEGERGSADFGDLKQLVGGRMALEF